MEQSFDLNFIKNHFMDLNSLNKDTSNIVLKDPIITSVNQLSSGGGNTGAGWGTDDSGNIKIDLNLSDIPNIFKLNVDKSVQPKSVTNQTKFKNRFKNSEMFFYKKMNICFDQALNVDLENDIQVLQLGLELLTGLKLNTSESYPLYLKNVIHFKNVNIQSLKSVTFCSVLIKKGKWSEFPYNQLQFLKNTEYSDWHNQVFAFYFQNNLFTIPVITVHPDILLDFDFTHRSENSYLEIVDKKITIDGNVLFLHELGHVFGLSHLQPDADSNLPSGASIMGADINENSVTNLQLRFRGLPSVWKKFDLGQLITYRTAFLRYLIKDQLISLPIDATENCIFDREEFSYIVGPIALNKSSFKNNNQEYKYVRIIDDEILKSSLNQNDSANNINNSSALFVAHTEGLKISTSLNKKFEFTLQRSAAHPEIKTYRHKDSGLLIQSEFKYFKQPKNINSDLNDLNPSATDINYFERLGLIYDRLELFSINGQYFIQVTLSFSEKYFPDLIAFLIKQDENDTGVIVSLKFPNYYIVSDPLSCHF